MQSGGGTAEAVPFPSALRGPFDFAQGRLLKRRSSTALHALVFARYHQPTVDIVG
jgi:hypothetical protein